MVTYRKDETRRPKGWNAGAPPHVGWWHVNAGTSDKYLSWWNGEFFGRLLYFGNDKDIKSKTYCVEKTGAVFDKWSWLWPENARVARVNTETGEVTGSGPCPYETDGKAWPFGAVKEKSADAPKLKKKPAGNRKVTRYVVMVGYGLGTTYPAATFECKKNAVEYIEREARSGRYETIYMDAIRFRSTEE